jgi:DnaK suppressor protein
MPRASKASGAARPLKAAKKAAGTTKKAAATKKIIKKATAKKAAPAKKAVSTTTTKKAAPAKKAAASRATPQKAAAKATPAKKAVPKKAAAPKAVPQKAARPTPVKKAGKVVFDKFMLEQQELLNHERATYSEQADALKAEADQLAAEMEPGDIQFDDESGEGATATVDRERDLALSAQARVEIEEIDFALAKLQLGTYGICESCGQPIPKARLKAIPHARLCVACKSGGLSRR